MSLTVNPLEENVSIEFELLMYTVAENETAYLLFPYS